jgi:ornithine cyclodeaminase/alanine dehydrogenase-like protein (mu-crystallin family)
VIRYLTDAQVEALLPAPAEACELARQTLVDLSRGLVDLPPKPSLRPRPDGFVNAMPAYSSTHDAVAVKIVGVYQSNRPRGLPTIAGVVVSVDPDTGRIRGILGAGSLTAARTAAATGACMARLAPMLPGPLALTGAGVEARTHLLVADALGWHDVVVYDHRSSNIDGLRSWADAHVPAVTLRAAASPAEAAEGAACVVTGIPIGATGGDVPAAAVRDDALVLPIDYSTSVGAELANSAELLTSDDPDQLASVALLGHFIGWRTLDGPTGRWLADDAPPRPAGRVVCANLGVGAHDAVFAKAILAQAEERGIGSLLDD